MNEDFNKNTALSLDISAKIVEGLNRRVTDAQGRFTDTLSEIYRNGLRDEKPQAPVDFWQSWRSYLLDAAQRGILFWDTLRQRGDNFIAQWQAGEPPVLHFDYEIIMDARDFEQPVNYALARIIPPDGVKVYDKKRPYIIIDPRAGQVPGIGGFKDDSQVGVALRAGHPVYFLIFFACPEPGQTILDVTAVEQVFIKKVGELHPDSNKPVLVGNCQAGWAVMMLASLDPDDVGVILINGAPLSYWSGAWTEGKGNNSMRYAGGYLGGSWTSSFAADLGDGLFDGAYLVQNFENLNPSNTLWTKYRTLYQKIDTEPPRFLEFERWWGAFSLMNREEIEWTVQNLFVGNDLWSGKVRSKTGEAFDLRDIHSPIVLFASLGDNITPPQQAFNWVADTYGSTEEIKARGQVIIGLLHKDIGHLGIFVSGKVAKKEYTELVSVIKNIELLPPGLYGMEIHDSNDKSDGSAPYTVSFVEFRLEDVVKRLNRLQREDEKVFVAVELISEFNQRAYELFAQPWVQSVANEPMARFMRLMNPSRLDKWGLSGALNPFMAMLMPVAEQIRKNRQPAAPDNLFSYWEEQFSETVVAALDFYRDVRDALGEAWFFSVYSSPQALRMVKQHGQDYLQQQTGSVQSTNPNDIPYVREALEAIDKGGFAEALSRTVTLLEMDGDHLSLHQLELASEIVERYRDLLPNLPPAESRRIRGEQQIICRYAPDQALITLPKLLVNRDDRQRYLKWLDILQTDRTISQHGPLTAEQLSLLKRIRTMLKVAPAEKKAGDRQDKPAARRTAARAVSAGRVANKPEEKKLTEAGQVQPDKTAMRAAAAEKTVERKTAAAKTPRKRSASVKPAPAKSAPRKAAATKPATKKSASGKSAAASGRRAGPRAKKTVTK